MGGLLQANDCEQLVRFCVGFVPVDVHRAPALVAEEHVFRNGEIRHQRQLLMDDDDAGFFAVADLLKMADLAVIYDFAAVAAEGVDVN